MVETSKKNTDFIAKHIGEDPEYFKELINLIFSERDPIPMRASWVIEKISSTNPDLLKPYLQKIIKHMTGFTHPGTKRNLLKCVSLNEIPEGTEGVLYDMCYNFVISRFEPPAVKVHSMQIMFNIARKEPDLKRELRLIIEELSNDNSAAIKSRCRHLIAEL